MEPGSEPWFGSVRPKQPIHSPVASFGRYLLLLLLGAELVDRHHHQRGLHAHHRAVAGVDALDLARDQAVADVVETRRRRRSREWSRRAGRARPSRGRSRGRSSRGGRPPARAAAASPGSSCARRRAPCARRRSAAASSSSGSSHWKRLGVLAIGVVLPFYGSCQHSDWSVSPRIAMPSSSTASLAVSGTRMRMTLP